MFCQADQYLEVFIMYIGQYAFQSYMLNDPIIMFWLTSGNLQHWFYEILECMNLSPKKKKNKLLAYLDQIHKSLTILLGELFLAKIEIIWDQITDMLQH